MTSPYRGLGGNKIIARHDKTGFNTDHFKCSEANGPHIVKTTFLDAENGIPKRQCIIGINP